MFYVSEGMFGGTDFIMLCVLHFGITIRDGKVSTAVHLSLHYCGMYWF